MKQKHSKAKMVMEDAEELEEEGRKGKKPLVCPQHQQHLGRIKKPCVRRRDLGSTPALETFCHLTSLLLPSESPVSDTKQCLAPRAQR